MKRLLLATAAGLMLSTGGSVAADLPPVRSEPRTVVVAPPVYSWTGCYVGAGGGYAMWNQETQTQTDPGGFPVSASLTQGGRGWFATGQGGCDLQIGSGIVFGVFGDYDYSINIKGNVTVPDNGVYGEEKLRWSWAAGGRIGWLPVPQLLTFFSAGFTQANFGQINLFSLATGAAVGQHLPAHTYNGWFLGSGYEYGIGWLPGLFWKTEYRFADYRGATLSVLTTATGATTGERMYSHKYIHSVRSELVWRFSFGGPLFARY